MLVNKMQAAEQQSGGAARAKENLLTFQGSWESANETTPSGMALLLQRPAVFTGDRLIATAQALYPPCKCEQPAHPLAATACAANVHNTIPLGECDVVAPSDSQALSAQPYNRPYN